MSQGVSNGQLANENTFNSGFMSRKDDTDTVGKVDLKNEDVLSGAQIFNIQKNINALASALGISVNQAADLVVTWASAIVGANTSSVVEKIEALVSKFDTTGGHNHDGTQGNGALISALNLLNLNKFEAQWQKVSKSGVSGLSVSLATELTGKTAGGTSSQVGVITAAPDNKCFIVDASNGTLVTDSSGRSVYGRLDASFLLTFYVFIGGVETAYNLPATDLDILFLEVFTIESRPTIPQFPALFGNLDTTNDVVDASATLAGKVNIGAQTFAGDKTFNGFLKLLSTLNVDVQVDSSSVGAVTLPTPTKVIYSISSAVTQINAITAPTNNQLTILQNKSGSAFILKANDTTADHIKMAADLVIENNSSAILYYDLIQARWILVSFSAFLQPQAVGASPNANGLTIVGNKVTLQPANNANPGVMTAAAQAIGGQKTFSDGLVALTSFIANAPAEFKNKVLGNIFNDTVSTGADQILVFPNKMTTRLANTGLLSLKEIDSPEAGKILFIINDTGHALVIKNDAGTTAAQGFYTGTGADISVPNQAVFMVVYDSNSSRWRVFGYFEAGGASGGAKYMIRFNLNGAYGAAPSYPQLDQDGHFVFPQNAQITNAILFVHTAGTGGTTELDIKKKPQASSTWTSIFTTTPKATSAAGSDKSIGVGQTVAGMTAAVLTANPLAVAQYDHLRVDIITAQTGSPRNCGIIIEYELV